MVMRAFAMRFWAKQSVVSGSPLRAGWCSLVQLQGDWWRWCLHGPFASFHLKEACSNTFLEAVYGDLALVLSVCRACAARIWHSPAKCVNTECGR
eukprot:UN1559